MSHPNPGRGRTARRAAASLAWVVAGAAPAFAQTDYRNLDDERPARTEDAFPIEHRAFELMAPFRLARRGGTSELALLPELMWGARRNVMVGASLPVVVGAPPAAPRGLAGPRLFAFLHLNAETAALPAFAVRTDVALPGGPLAGDAALVTFKGIATRTWGRWRTHVNVAATLGAAADAPLADRPERWSASLAMDHSFLRVSTLAIGEVQVARELDGATVWHATLGGRRQMTPDLVLDAGVTAQLAGPAPRALALSVGLSHTFAFRAFAPGGVR